MSKKRKKSIELSDKKINFMLEKVSYKVIRYYPTAMSIDVMVSDENGEKKGMQNIPFAHVPKNIKKIIKPN
ncbi:MAG: hypothetical protein U9N33_03225 [Campylobacterota bacterium]|nr:hypothetical protein [Campylobacterota bacterium]